MKTDAERGRWGRFLRGERTKRGLSQEQVRQKLLARGFAVGESSYAEWESGYKQPTREAQQQFRALWASEPEPEVLPSEPKPPADMAALVAAITDLVAELKLSRWAEGERWEMALRALGVSPSPGEGGESRERPASGAPRQDRG